MYVPIGDDGVKLGLSDSEESLCRTLFELFDTDRSGYIDLNELVQILAYMGAVISKSETVQILGNMDVDGSGCLDQNEFLMFLKVYKETCRLRIIQRSDMTARQIRKSQRRMFMYPDDSILQGWQLLVVACTLYFMSYLPYAYISPSSEMAPSTVAVHCIASFLLLCDVLVSHQTLSAEDAQWYREHRHRQATKTSPPADAGTFQRDVTSVGACTTSDAEDTEFFEDFCTQSGISSPQASSGMPTSPRRVALPSEGPATPRQEKGVLSPKARQVPDNPPPPDGEGPSPPRPLLRYPPPLPPATSAASTLIAVNSSYRLRRGSGAGEEVGVTLAIPTSPPVVLSQSMHSVKPAKICIPRSGSWLSFGGIEGRRWSAVSLGSEHSESSSGYGQGAMPTRSSMRCTSNLQERPSFREKVSGRPLKRLSINVQGCK